MARSTSVVVPEAGAQPLWDAGAEDRLEAALPQRVHVVSGDLEDAGVGQGGEQVGGAGGAVAPRVGDRLHLAGGRRDRVRDDEPSVVQ